MTGEPLLEVRDLEVHFPIERGVFFRKEVGRVRAVDGVSFTLRKGETLGLVGESGCGKSTTARGIIRLVKPTGGSVQFRDHDLARIDEETMRRDVRRHLQMIFQDPYACLNPRMTVEQLIAEPLWNFRYPGPVRAAGGVAQPPSAAAIRDRVVELLRLVGLSERHRDRYPHEFSGGQRQRIGIARALAADPDVVVCDEPVSALDVSIQAQVVNLLQDLQQRLGLTYLFIAHDLAVVRHISDRVAVMYLGHIMELTDRDSLFENPLHPYTKALLSAVPVPARVDAGERIILLGDVPRPPPPTRDPRCPSAQLGEPPARSTPGGVGVPRIANTGCGVTGSSRAPYRNTTNKSGPVLGPLLLFASWDPPVANANRPTPFGMGLPGFENPPG